MGVAPKTQEWIVPFDDAGAVAELWMAFVREPTTINGLPIVERFVGALPRGLRVDVLSREHPPPHFRVSKDGESGNYRISDCMQINGGLQREYGIIRDWHSKNKQKLIETWNTARPSDCPVGAYRED